MKKLIYFILISLLGFTSCKKDGSNPVDSNTIPAMPTLSTPKDTASNIAVPAVLTWNESGGAKSYILQVSANSSFSSFVFNKSDITSTTQQISELNYLSIYYWRVSASNSVGSSDWSNIWSFTTTGEEPALVPQLSLPANGEVEQKLSPVLVWDKVNNANSYTLQISTNSSFTNYVFNNDTLVTTTRQITDLNGLTKYYWRVSATNNFGTKGWSQTWSFTTGVAPTPPVLLSPIDGATEVTLSPTLTWNAITGAASYTLQVSTNSSFLSFVFNQSSSTANKQIMGLANSTKYYWRVSTTNDYGTSSLSNVWNFTTGEPPAIQIGSQFWMKENLNVGTMIPSTGNASNNGTIEKYCYSNDTANCRKYGGLYQWDEAMQYSITPGAQGICPTGWHLPTQAEFQTLAAAVSNNSNALKAVGQGTGNGAGTNTSGFSALLVAYRFHDGVYIYYGYSLADFWSSTQYSAVDAHHMNLNGNVSGIGVVGHYDKDYGFSVRCLKDQ